MQLLLHQMTKKVDPYVDPEVEEQLYNINKITDPKERFKLLTKQWLTDDKTFSIHLGI